MRYYQLLTGLAVLISTSVAQAETYSPPCPAEIKTQEQISTAPQGWESMSDTAPHFLSGVAFYAGHPKEEASLAPEPRDKVTNQWNFSAQDAIYIVCTYNKSSMQLTQQLQQNTTGCTVTYDNSSMGDNGYLPKQITCTK